MKARHLRMPVVTVALLVGGAGLALAGGGTTSGGSTTGGSTVTTTGTAGGPTGGTTTSVPVTTAPAPRDDRTDWSWLGLLGLAGLGGLLRRRENHTTTHVAPAGTTTRM